MSDKKKNIYKTNFKYLYNTRKYLFWAGFLVLLMVGLLFFSLIPQINLSFKSYDSLISENKKAAQLRIKAAQLDESSSSLLLSNKDKIEQVLPSKKPLLELLSGLNHVGNKTKVAFTEISLSPGLISTQSAALNSVKSPAKSSRKKSSTGYEVLNLDVTVNGEIGNINKFLAEIEEIAPFSTVVALALNERSDRNKLESFDQAMFEAKITISTYFFTKEISSALSTSLPELTNQEREAIELLQNFTYPSLDQQVGIRGGGLENLFPSVNIIPGLENFNKN